MKTALALAFAAMMLVTVGCQRKGTKPVDSADYDPKTDGGPAMLTPKNDENLVEDQKVLSRQIAAAMGAPGATPATTSAPAAGTGTTAPAGVPTAAVVESIRTFVSQLAEAQKANDVDKALSFYSTEDVNVVKPAIAISKELPAKVQAFQKLLQNKGFTLSDEMKKELSAVEGVKEEEMASPGIEYGKTPIDQFKFEQVGDNVVVVSPDKQRETFVKSAGAWKVQLDPQIREMISAKSDLFTGIGKWTDALTAGINDGSITKDNFEAKAKEADEKDVKPAADKFGKLVGEILKKAFEGMGKTSGDSSAPGATTAPATPAP